MRFNSAQIWTLQPDRRWVKLRFPLLSLTGVDISAELDAAAVDDILKQLTELRVKMLPAPEHDRGRRLENADTDPTSRNH